MKFWSGILCASVILLSQSSLNAKALDPFWMFHDPGDGISLIYQYFICHDTLRSMDMYDYYPTDTPASESFDGSEFIKFNYQFSADTQYYRDEFDTNIVKWKGYRPGYAGFKTAWDYGMNGFPVARYKKIALAHKGPLPQHKVSIWFWYNNGGCGVPSFKEFIGAFNASSAWKVDTIPIPDVVQDKSDSARNFKYYEMVFLINNADPNSTAMTSEKGSLSIDNIVLIGRNPIDTSPQSKTVSSGTAATFKVATTLVNTTDQLTYQWKKDGAPLNGATSASYTIASAQSSDAGAYTVAVTVNAANTFTSQKGTLTIGIVGTAPVITTQPKADTVTTGGSASFSVTATGTPAPTYQWKKDGQALTGATSATYSIASAKTADAGSYTAVVTNSAGSVTSNAAVLTVQAPPEQKKSGCGSGFFLAFIPPVWFKARTMLKRNKRGSGQA